MSMIRSRWAAIGAAIAVSLGAGGIGLVSATVTSGDRAVFVPIEPCRIADTRPAKKVGPRSAPLGQGDTHTVQAWGTNGECTIPNDATALSLNVTALSATQNSYMTIWGGGDKPKAASLNPIAGAGPTPNAVNTPLTTTGAFNVYNDQGNVHIVIDVNGYYANHNHDDRYYTKTQTDQRYAPAETLVVVDALDFVLLGANWTQSDLLTRVNGGSSSCARAPLELPIGASLESVTLVYLTLGTTVDVKIGSTSRAAGSYSSDLLVSGAETVPFVGEFVMGRASIPVDDSGPIVAGSSYFLDICGQEGTWVSAVEIVLS